MEQTMHKTKIWISSVLWLMSVCSCAMASFPTDAPSQTQRFEFVYQDLKYVGEIVHPSVTGKMQAAKGTVVIIPGHGPTEFVDGQQWTGERAFFPQQGYCTVYWDKAGNGLSEGQYDHNQSIESSANEAIAAINAIKAIDPGFTQNLGFWSISRGGWIVPKITELATEEFGEVSFWISVSGTIELDIGRYTLEANLKAENRDRNEIAILMSEWDHYQRILVRGGSFEEFQSRTQNLM